MPVLTRTEGAFGEALVSVLRRLTESAGFSYSTIMLLQLKAVWGMWALRDMTPGDTSSYFVSAYTWFTAGRALISWSPLYVSFYGSLLHLSPDAFLVTLLHRLLIVFALAILILAVMRRLLPADIAWFMTAWWVVMPIDFDAMYEVHLFAVVPLMIAVLLIVGEPARLRRGLAFGCLLATALLVRNEILVATAMLMLAAATAGAWRIHSVRQWPRVRLSPILAYSLPVGAACLLTFYYYRHASDAQALSAMLERKHTLNVCQVYAFGYQQRNDDFKKSPWTDCQELMTRVYGVPEPSLLSALRRNPRAMMTHFLWNLRLLPAGLQVLLFNVTSSSVTPDYVPVANSSIAIPASLLLLGVVAAGLTRLLKDRRRWWQTTLRERRWGWMALLAFGCVTFAVMITQRPRPSYMFTLGILLRAATGTLCLVLLDNTVWRRRIAGAFPVAAVLLIVLAPIYRQFTHEARPRYLAAAYERLRESERIVERPGTVFMTPGYGLELCNYVGKGKCAPRDYFALRAEMEAGATWMAVLAEHGVNLVYANELVFAEPAGQRLVTELQTDGWRTLGMLNEGDRRWILMSKPDASTSASAAGFPCSLRASAL